MKVDFDTADHGNPTDCQLFLALTGPKQFIIDQLKRLIVESEDHHGKPRQGIMNMSRGNMHVITPLWNGEKY